MPGVYCPRMLVLSFRERGPGGSVFFVWGYWFLHISGIDSC